MNVKKIFYKCSTLLLPIIRRFYTKRLTVLAYHTVPDHKIFEEQIKYLKNTYNIISLKQLQFFFDGNINLPKNPLLITFDDGDYSLFKNALPIFKNFNVPAVIFIISELINSENTFWCRWVEAVYDKEGKSYIEARKEVNRLKRIPNAERRKVLDSLPEIKSRQLNVKELKEMERSNISIGNHTHTHPMLDQCTPEEISEEMNEVKTNFTRWGLLGYPYFAYPNGNADLKTEGILISKGIKMAFLFDHNINQKKVNPLRISRIRVNADSDRDEFRVKVSGLHTLMMRIKDRILSNN